MTFDRHNLPPTDVVRRAWELWDPTTPGPDAFQPPISAEFGRIYAQCLIRDAWDAHEEREEREAEEAQDARNAEAKADNRRSNLASRIDPPNLSGWRYVFSAEVRRRLIADGITHVWMICERATLPMLGPGMRKSVNDALHQMGLSLNLAGDPDVMALREAFKS